MSAPMPQLAWVTSRVDDLARSLWQVRAFWPFPLSASPVGRWELPLPELLGEVDSPALYRPRGEQRLVETLAGILRRPAYCAYVIRLHDDVEDYYAAIAGADDVVLVVTIGEQVHLARVPDTHIAVALAGQVPVASAAPTPRIEIPAQTAELIGSGLRRKVPARTLRSAMATAGIPETLAERLLADESAVTATGTVGAVRYGAGAPAETSRPAGWTEMADGGMISVTTRSGSVSWEPMSANALARAVADALTGLGS